MQATQEDPSNAPAQPLRFTYASGSRPLDGYTIKRGVGRGGFGEVYYALSDAGKEVALKLIRRNLDIELRGVTQCLNLKNPHLLLLYDVRQDAVGDSWVIMEYIRGEPLDAVLAAAPAGLPEAEALAWFHGIAAGVSYLHDHGIVHRDLKPGNIFCDEGLVKLGDYGLSKFISASRRSGQTESVGTVHYMAPEIANGRYGKEIDIYALGIVLYEMLTGHVPFEGESVGEVLMKHLTAEPDLSRLAEPYRTCVGRALTKDPAHRVSSVAEMAALLPPAPAGTILHPGAGGPPRSVVAAEVLPLACGAPIPPVSPVAAGGPTSAAQRGDDEPILRFLREQAQRLGRWWNDPTVATPVKVLVVVAAGYLLLQFSPVIAVGAVPTLAAYGIYRVIRAIVIAPSAPRAESAPAGLAPGVRPAGPPPAAAVPVAGATPQFASPPPPPIPPAAAPAAHRGTWRERLVRAMPVKTPHERATDLLGSLLLAGLVCAGLALVLLVFRGQQPTVEEFTWLTLTSILGAWAVLIPAKFWEGRRGEHMLRRFTLLLSGLAVGGAAWTLKLLLGLELRTEIEFPAPVASRMASLGGLYNVWGDPLVFPYLMYFSFLLFVLRWWRLTDPLRTSRLNVWHTGIVVGVAWVLNWLWPFPQPWGLIVAGTMAVAVQLSSPWIEEPEENEALA